MRKRINLIISSLSLIVTLTLLIVFMYAWYIVNETAQAVGIIAKSDSVKGSFEFYYFNDTSHEDDNGQFVESGSWVRSNNSLIINDAWPTDVFYFKIVGTNLESGQKLNIKFSGISSFIDDKAVTGHKVNASGTTPAYYDVRYESISGYTSQATTFNVDYYDANAQTPGNVTKTLYELEANEDYTSGYEVTLKDILIEDCFKLYTNPTFKTVGTMTDFPSSKGTTSVDIDDTFFNSEIVDDDGGTKSIYFALSFDSQDVVVNNKTIHLDNFYMYQGINISSININLV